MTVCSFFEGVVNPSNPVVWITIATVSCHSPFGYTVASITVFRSHISYWDSQSSVLTREGPLASRLWMTPCQRNAWREERAVQPQSLDQCLEKQHILFQSQTCHPSGAIEKPCLSPGCLSGQLSLWSWRHWKDVIHGSSFPHTPNTHTAALSTCMWSLSKQIFLCFQLPGHSEASY